MEEIVHIKMNGIGNMSLYEEYYEETGLHAFYKRQVANINKQELVFTRKYTWWCEEKIKELQKQLQEILQERE